MRARDLMTEPAITCHVNDALGTAAQRMWDRDIGAIIVVNDDGKLAGIVTDRDICMAAHTRGRLLDDLLVNSAMSTHLTVAGPDATIGELEELMSSHQIRRIPIIDEERRPLGMVSLNDLAIESVQPDTRQKNGAAKLAHTLAAICRPRVPSRRAA
jgi:CBS domain-containing protein